MASLINLDPKALESVLNQLINLKRDIEDQKKILDEKEKNIPNWEDEQFRTFQGTMGNINSPLNDQIKAIEKEISRVKDYIDDTMRAMDKFK